MSDNQIPAEQWFSEGKALRLSGQYAQAIDALQHALALTPEHAGAHLELGLAYCYHGLFDESLQELRTAAALDPTNPEILVNLAKTFAMLGMYDEAIADFRVVLDITPHGSKLYEEAQRQLSYFAQLCS